MSKVICEICGTTYQDTAECCPICGCPRDMSGNVSDDDFLKDTEIVREHHNKTTTCPKCGEVFEI